MLFTRHGFKIFNEYNLYAVLQGQITKLKETVEHDAKSLKTNAEDYIQSKIKEYQINPLELEKDSLSVTAKEEMVPAEYFPSNFFVEAGGEYPKQVLTFHLPFKGDDTLLKCVPSTRILWTEQMDVEGNEIVFELINFSDDVEALKRERDRIVKYLVDQSANVNREINEYNLKLRNIIENALSTANVRLQKQSDLLNNLGTPIKISKSSTSIESDENGNIPQPTKDESKQFDVFICHASEDKKFVQSLAEAIRDSRIEVWYDDYELNWGDDLRSSIDNGLKNSKFGIVVFSKAFFNKKRWTEHELNGLFAKERKGKKVILPIWYEVSQEDVAAYSPAFADRLAKMPYDIEGIKAALKKLLGK